MQKQIKISLQHLKAHELPKYIAHVLARTFTKTKNSKLQLDNACIFGTNACKFMNMSRYIID